MEATVTKLEIMFQKAESDLDCVQRMLEYEISKGLPEGLSEEENPLTLTQQFSEMKLRYKTLCEKLDHISAERQESVRSLHATLDKTMKLVQEIQQHAGVEILSLSEEEQLAMQHLMRHSVKAADVPAEQDCLKDESQ